VNRERASSVLVKFGDAVTEYCALSDPSLVTFDGARSYVDEWLWAVGRSDTMIVSMGTRSASSRDGGVRLEVVAAFGPGGIVRRIARFAAGCVSLLKLLSSAGPDLTVCVDAGYFAPVVWFDALRRRSTLLLCIAGEVAGPDASRLRRRIVRFVGNSRSTHAVVGRGDSLARQLREAGVQTDRVTSYYPIYDSSLALLRRAASSEADGVVRCVYLGRLSQVKGVRDLSRVAAALARLQYARLTVIGDGPLRAELESVLEAAGLSGVVEMLGGMPSLAALERVAGADVMVVPSVSEGIGKSAMEASIVGVPVVAYAVGGIPDCVQDGFNGLLVDAGEADALARAVATVCSDVALRTRLRQGARAMGDTLVNLQPTFEQVVREAIAAHVIDHAGAAS
jgi:glycosyltransferase involved in cell wall biosynthesis